MMYLVNNRYRIIKNIKQDILLSSFTAIDILNNKKVQLNLVNCEQLTEKLKTYFFNEFSVIKNIASSNIIKLYDFETIYSIDNKRVLDATQYYYTSEAFEADRDISYWLKNFSEYKLISIFVEICQSINYLHLKGFCYNALNPQNILISHKSGSFKLKDFATVKLEKSFYWTFASKYLYFKAPEVNKGEEPSVYSDIYSLGVLLLTFMKRDIQDDMNVYEEVDVTFDSLFHKLSPVVKKMISIKPQERYETIFDLITDINEILSENFLPHRKQEVAKLNINIKLVGRQFEIDTVLKAYKSVSINQDEGKFILIHGESGIGKSRLLGRLKHLLCFDKANVYYSLHQSFSNSADYKPVNEILKQFISESDSDILSRYENELVKFVPELGENKEILPTEPLDGDMEKFRLMNRIMSFITECSKSRTLILIIDDIHLADEFSLELIQYIYSRKNKNILFILSYSDSYNNSRKMTKFLSSYRKKTLTIDITLRGLSLEETKEMLTYIIFLPKAADKVLASKIYDKTYGNPQFILETIKNLYTKGIIYINNQGIWLTDYNFDDLPLPLNMEQAVLSQIKNLNEDSLKFLGNLSIFNSAVPLTVLVDFEGDFVNDVEKILKFLLDSGLLCEKIEDFGYSYDFSNSMLKNIIYSRLETDDRLSKHEKAAKLLENFYKSGRISSEELIYHLEKCGKKDSIIQYCIANADLMEKLKNREEVIKNLRKAISVFENESADKVKVELLIRLAYVYLQDGNIKSSLKYYKMAEKDALKLGDLKRLINVTNKIFSFYYCKGDKENSIRYAEKSKDILEKIQDNILGDYIEEYLDYEKNRLSLIFMNKEYEKAYCEAQEILKLCDDRYLKQKSAICYSLGSICVKLSKEEEALSFYNQSYNYSKEIDDWSSAANALNNVGVIYGDYYQDYVKAVETYQTLRDIGEKNNLIVPQALSLINLGDSYSYLLDYKQSYKYLMEALEVALKSENEYNIYYCYTYLINTCLKVGLYREAWEYYTLAKKYINDGKVAERDKDIYFQSCAVLFYEIYDISNAEIMVNKAIEAYGNLQSIQSLDCKVLYQFISINKDRSVYSIDESLQTINRLIDSYSFDIAKANTIYDTAILLMDVGEKVLSHKCINSAEERISMDLPKKIEAKRLYVKGIIDDSDKKLEYLNAALKICGEEDMLVLKAKVFTSIGDYYLNNNKYYAVNYYFEACEIIRKLTVQLPEEIQLQYVQQKSILLPFIRLMSMNDKVETIKYNNIEELRNLFKHNSLKHILNDIELKNSAREIYCSDKSYQFEGVDDLLTRLDSKSENDFILLCKYLSSLTLATKGLLIIDNHNGESTIFAASESSDILPETKYVLDRVRSEKKPVMITSMEMLSTNKKAVICIPIVKKDTLIGYVYMESEKIVNDFNEESLEKCMKLNNLIALLIEKYQLKISSSLDVLTGTLTRKTMEETIEKTIKRTSLARGIFAIIMLDLDFFKSINDRFGHQTGDMVLKNVCKIILDNLTEADDCGRYGGEEFVIILPNTDLAKACNIAENIMRKVENAKILGDKTTVTISMGIAVFPSHGQMSQELIEKADQALYMAKKAGRNRYQVWEDKFSNKANVTNILSGILTGNAVQDYRNVSVIVEFINLIKLDEPVEDKIYKFLGRIIEITEAQTGILFIVDDDKVGKKYERKLFSENWCKDDVSYNHIVDSVIESKQGACYIDWEDVNVYDPLTGVPDWPSVIAIPLINSGITKGILYLSVPVRKKEFKFSDYNFVESLSQIVTSII